MMRWDSTDWTQDAASDRRGGVVRGLIVALTVEGSVLAGLALAVWALGSRVAA